MSMNKKVSFQQKRRYSSDSDSDYSSDSDLDDRRISKYNSIEKRRSTVADRYGLDASADYNRRPVDFEGDEDDYEGPSFASMFDRRYAHFTLFILFELVNVIGAWYMYYVVTDTMSYMKKLKSGEGLGNMGYVAKTAFSAAMAMADMMLNRDDYIFYMAIAILITIIAMYSSLFLSIMRDLKHAPVVLGLKALSVIIFLGVVIYERMFYGDAWDAVWNLIGDKGYQTAVPIASVLAVVNLAAGVFLYFMFFVQSERDADYRRHQRQQALAASRASQAAPRSNSRKNRKSKKSSRHSTDYSDSESDSDIEFARKSSKSKKGKKSSRKSSSKSKKQQNQKKYYEPEEEYVTSSDNKTGYYPAVGSPAPLGGSWSQTTYTTSYPAVQGQTIYGLGDANAQPLLAGDSNVKRHVIELPPPKANGETQVYQINLGA